MSSGIQFTGLASGLDTESIITQLMAVERQPRTRLTLKQAAAQAQEDSLSAIRTKLTSLNLATSGLSSAALWEPTQSVDTTDSTKVTARRTGGAGPGGYQLAVTNLASSEQRTFALGDTSQQSTLTLKGAWQTAGIDVTVNAGATVDDVVSAINAKSDAPVYAVNVNGALVLSSKKTGTSFGFTVSGDTQLTGSTVKAGADAAYTVDGVAKTSATNVVSDGIPGVELTLRAPTSSAVTVNVGTPAPKSYDELYLSEQSDKGFIHLDVDKLESGDVFVLRRSKSLASGIERDDLEHQFSRSSVPSWPVCGASEIQARRNS